MGKEYSKESINLFFTDCKFDQSLFTKHIVTKKNLPQMFKFNQKLEYVTNQYKCFEGEIIKTGKKVFVKKIYKNNEGEILFKKEILLLEYLDHPNILPIYEYFQTKNSYYIFYHHFEGKNLLEYPKQMDEEVLRTLIFEFCRVLFYMHSKNIAHRNLDPELIKWNGEKIMISYFQDACFFKHNDNTEKEITKKFSLTKLQNEYFVSPEMFEEQYDEKSDIWSMGVLLYILITGKAPIVTVDASRFREKIINHEVNILPLKNSKMSSALVDFVLRCLEKNPNMRLGCAELLEHKWFSSLKKKKQLDIEEEILKQSMTVLESKKKKGESEMSSELQEKNLFIRFFKKFYLTRFLTLEERAKLEKEFKITDQNMDGVISSKEFMKICKNISKEDLIFFYNNNMTKHMEYRDYIFLFADNKYLKDEKKLKELFYFFEHQNLEFISYKDIELALDFKKKNKFLINIFDKFSKNHYLNLEDFIHMMKFIFKNA